MVGIAGPDFTRFPERNPRDRMFGGRVVRVRPRLPPACESRLPLGWHLPCRRPAGGLLVRKVKKRNRGIGVPAPHITLGAVGIFRISNQVAQCGLKNEEGKRGDLGVGGIDMEDWFR